MDVTRVREDGKSRVEPPMDPGWDALTRLQWHAAVVEHDTGLPVAVREEAPSRYVASVGRGYLGGLSYRDTWVFLNGVDTGACEAMRGSRV